MPQYMLLMYHPVEGGPSPEEMAEQHAIRFIDQIRRAFRRVNIELRGVLTDNGPEWVSRDFQQHRNSRESLTGAPRRAHPTTTPCASASKASPCRSSSDPPSTANASTASRISTPSCKHGFTATTPAAPTTAPTCADAPPPNCSDNTDGGRPDEPPPVNTNRDQDALERPTLAVREHQVRPLLHRG